MKSYNQTVFSGGLRSHLHKMRFKWLKQHLNEKENAYSVFELGCFDCRSLHFIPKPSRYVGADAGWEGGIEDARMTYNNPPWMELVMSLSVHDITRYKDDRFDYSIALETLEHIPDPVLRGYLEFLAKVTRKRLLITVPVEIGPVFLAKHMAKNIITGHGGEDEAAYSWKEIYWATRGRVEHIRRFENKGFDYRALIKLIGEYFTVKQVEGIPFKRYPQYSFQVGIIAEPKRKHD